MSRGRQLPSCLLLCNCPVHDVTHAACDPARSWHHTLVLYMYRDQLPGPMYTSLCIESAALTSRRYKACAQWPGRGGASQSASSRSNGGAAVNRHRSRRQCSSSSCEHWSQLGRLCVSCARLRQQAGLPRAQHRPPRGPARTHPPRLAARQRGRVSHHKQGAAGAREGHVHAPHVCQEPHAAARRVRPAAGGEGERSATGRPRSRLLAGSS